MMDWHNKTKEFIIIFLQESELRILNGNPVTIKYLFFFLNVINRSCIKQGYYRFIKSPPV